MDRLATASQMIAQIIATADPAELAGDKASAQRIDFALVEGGDAGLSWNPVRKLWIASLRRKAPEPAALRQILASCARAKGRGDVAGLDVQGRIEVWSVLPYGASAQAVAACYARLESHFAQEPAPREEAQGLSALDYAMIRL